MKRAALVSLRARHPGLRSLVYRLAPRLVYCRRVRLRLAALLHLHHGEHLRRKIHLTPASQSSATSSLSPGAILYTH